MDFYKRSNNGFLTMFYNFYSLFSQFVEINILTYLIGLLSTRSYYCIQITSKSKKERI